MFLGKVLGWGWGHTQALGRLRQAQSQIQDQPGLYSEVLFKNKSLPHIPVQPGKESHDHHAEGPGRHAQVPEREWAETNR